jgi:hypothetical protein
MKHQHYLTVALGSVLLFSGFAHAQNQKNSVPPVVLTEAGKALESKYTAIQNTLKAELQAALPKLDDAKIASWQQAILAEEGPAKEAGDTVGLHRHLQ